MITFKSNNFDGFYFLGKDSYDYISVDEEDRAEIKEI